jgi:hypothetical protein
VLALFAAYFLHLVVIADIYRDWVLKRRRGYRGYGSERKMECKAIIDSYRFAFCRIGTPKSDFCQNPEPLMNTGTKRNQNCNKLFQSLSKSINFLICQNPLEEEQKTKTNTIVLKMNLTTHIIFGTSEIRMVLWEQRHV